MLPPPLNRQQTLRFSLGLCIPISIVNLSILLITGLSPNWIPSARELVSITIAGTACGVVKALLISAVVYQFKPAWRRPMILGNVIVLTLLESLVLYGWLHAGIAVA